MNPKLTDNPNFKPLIAYGDVMYSRIEELEEADDVYCLHARTGEYFEVSPFGGHIGCIYAIPIKTWRTELSKKLKDYPELLARICELMGDEKLDKVFTEWRYFDRWDRLRDNDDEVYVSFRWGGTEEGWDYFKRVFEFMKGEIDTPFAKKRLLTPEELARKWIMCKGDWQQVTRICRLNTLSIFDANYTVEELHQIKAEYADTYKGELKSLEVEA